MKTTVIAQAKLNPTQTESAQRYSTEAKAIIEQFGGNFSGRFQSADLFAGHDAPDITLFIDFPNREKARECFNSNAYKALVPLRDTGFESMRIYLLD